MGDYPRRRLSSSGPGTDPWSSHPLPPISSTGTPLCIRYPSHSVKTDNSSFPSKKEVRSLRALRCMYSSRLVLKRSCTSSTSPPPPPPPAPLSPEPSLQPDALASEVSGRNQTNFLPNIHEQNKMCLKWGNASFCTITITCHFKSIILSETVWDQIH